MRKGAERAGNGRKPPGEKTDGDLGGIRGGRGGSVLGGYGRGQCGSYSGTVYDVGVFPAQLAAVVPCSLHTEAFFV